MQMKTNVQITIVYYSNMVRGNTVGYAVTTSEITTDILIPCLVNLIPTTTLMISFCRTYRITLTYSYISSKWKYIIKIYHTIIHFHNSRVDWFPKQVGTNN